MHAHIELDVEAASGDESDGTGDETTDETAEGQLEATGPGFGVLGVLVALLELAAVGRRR